MADRVLRGSRLGAVSYETDRNHDLAPRQSMRYACPRGHEFDVPIANDAEVPLTWECRLHGSISRLVDGSPPEQEGQAAADALGHAAGAPLGRRAGGAPHRAPRAARGAARRDRLTPAIAEGADRRAGSTA